MRGDVLRKALIKNHGYHGSAGILKRIRHRQYMIADFIGGE